MKRITASLVVCCFLLSITAVAPRPLHAADDSGVLVIITVGTVVGLGAILGLIFAGQASERSEIEEKYNPRLGKWTYDEMVSEMGEPQSVAEGKGVLLVQYHDSKTVNVGKTVYHEGNFLSEASSETETELATRYYGKRFSFYFDRQKKVFRGWQCLNMNSDGASHSWSAEGGDTGFAQETSVKKTAAATAPAAPAAEKSLEQKLTELKDLKDKKLISGEEYKSARQKLLDNAVK